MQTFLRSKALFPLLSLVLLLTSCTYENVDVEDVTGVKIQKLDKNGISFTAKLKINNPNNYKIHITSTDADLFLDGRKAGKAELENKMVIPANFNDEIEAKVRTDFEGGSLQLIPIILGAAVSKRVSLQAKGTLKARSFIIGQKFDFDYSHEAKF
ncbi:LEA type 2 family protein [Cryomorphaceae bacterium 1068]|nr:LEA type 2 family protein [Cryomorphaceae bacterium 1068]